MNQLVLVNFGHNFHGGGLQRIPGKLGFLFGLSLDDLSDGILQEYQSADNGIGSEAPREEQE